MNIVKNTKRFFSAITLFFGLLIIGAMSFSGCEVGLGPAVDTQPPGITILTPEVDKVVRDKFAVSGTWSDDGTIKDISVVLKRTDGKTIQGDKTEYKFSATFETSLEEKGTGTWRAVVDPFEENNTITDGTYQATVIIRDNSSHSTTQNTTFTIDNTPPVIVLTRPSTSAVSASSDTYGQTFNLEGQAADTNNVSLIEVEIYNDPECTPESHVHTVPLKNVPNSINMDVAKFEKGDETNDYFKIYGHSDTDAGEQTFYLKLVAYDGAERYPADGTPQTEEDKKGNPANYYYLYKDIATAVLQDYKITEVYSIYNGTYTEASARSVTTTDVLTLLEQKKITKGKFTLNPKNNPTFAITGRSPLVLDGTDFTNGRNDVSSGGQIVIEVSPGLDGILLDESTLKVYAQKCDANGHIAAGTPKIYPTTTKQESGTSYRFATTILRTDGFEIGENYIFGVEGNDLSATKNRIEPSGRAYGIHLASSGNAPKLEVTTPDAGDDVYLKQGQSQVFEGTVSVEAGVPVLKIYKGNNPEPIRTIVYTEGDGTYNGSNYVYTFSETISDFGTTSGKSIFKFVATQDGVDSPVVEREVIYDILTPEVSITEPAIANKYDAQGVLDTSAKFVNQVARFEATIKDKGGSNLESAKYEVIVDGTTVITNPIDLDQEILIPIDTSDTALNGKSFTFRITAKDNAGNIFATDDATYTYKADQNTDKPYLVKHTLTADEIADGKKELDFTLTSITTYNGLTKENKLGTVTKGDYIKFNCYDDDGTVQITIKNKKLTSDSDWETNTGALTQVYSKSKDTKTLTAFDDYQFPNTDEECGFYEYAIILSDGTETTITGPFLVNVAKERASIKVEATPEWAKDGNSFTTTITITPSMGKYYAYKKIGDGDYSATAFKETDELVINDSIAVTSLPNDETKVTYKVVDGNNQTSNEVPVILKKDNTAPEILSINSPAEGKVNKQAISDDEYAFRGDVKDNKSGTKYIYYYFGDETETTAPTMTNAAGAPYTRVEASNGNYIINKAIDSGTSAATAGNLHEGRWYLYIIAEDVAGNKTNAVSRMFDIDKSAPEITEVNDDDLGYKNGAFTLQGTVTETNGLASTDGLVITDDKNSTYKKTVTPTVTSSGITWSQEITGLAEGKHTLSITAKDKAGKTATIKRIVTIDTVKPVVSETMTLPNGLSFDGSTISLSGTATDTTPSSGLSKVEYYFEDRTTSTVKKSQTFTAEGQAYWSASVNTADLSATNMNGVFASQGQKYVTVVAYDNAGNASESVSKSFIYDTQNPVIDNVKIQFTDEADANDLGTATIYTKINGYTISGDFSDTGSAVTISATSNGDSVTTVSQTGEKSGTWNFTTSSLDDGTYTYNITAKDASQRTVTKTAYVVVDKEAPKPAITETVDDIYTPSGAYTFTGTVEEAYLDNVWAYLYKTGTTAAVKSERIYPVNGDWTWTVAGLLKGQYSIKIVAKDKAGNEGTKESSKKLIVDTEAPELNITSTNLQDSSGTAVAAATKLLENNTYYTRTDFTLIAAVTEDNIRAVTVSKDGGTATPLTSSNGKYTYDPGTIDGTHNFTITATDKATNVTEFKVTVSKDTTAPYNPVITAPAAGKTGTDALSDNTFIFRGTAADETNGSGIAKILYQFTASTVTTAPASGYSEIATSGGNWTITKTIDSGTTASGDNLCEGKYYLYVKAQDKAGNVSEATGIRFDIDKTSPVITTKLDGTELTLATEQKKPGAYTFNFAITESNSFSTIITVKKGNDSLTLGSGYYIKNGSTSITNLSSITSGTEYTIEIPSQADALYTYTISVEDGVGKTASVTRLVRLDKSGPTISVTSPNFENWQNTKAFSVIGNATDDSGTSAVYWSLNSQKTIPTTNVTNLSSWTANGWTRANGSDSWNISLTNVPDSETNKLYIAAVDTIGNVSSEAQVEAQVVTMKVDSSAPALENFFYQLGTGDIKQAENTVYINTNGNPSLTVYGTYSDADSGVVALTTNPSATIQYSTTEITNTQSISSISNWASYNDANKKTIKSWKAVYTPTAGGSFAITGTNNAGLETQKNAFTLVVDNKEPSVNAAFYLKNGENLEQAFLKNGNYYINHKTPSGKKFTVSGNSTDNYLLEKAVLELKEKESGGKSITKTETFDSAVGEFEFEAFSLADWTTVYSAKLTVYDKAGNKKEVPLSIQFDTTGPVGYHEVDDMNKDLYFRIGSSDNDDIDSSNDLWDAGLDLDVGGKYSEGTYGKDSQIRVRGNITDAGSGVKTIYYRIFDKEIVFHGTTTSPTDYEDTDDNNKQKYAIKDAASLRDYVKAHSTGSFGPTGAASKRVFYNVATTNGHIYDDSTQLSATPNKNNCYTYYKTVDTTYDYYFDGFTNPQNYLVIVAEDNIGNIAIDFATVGEGDNAEEKYFAALNYDHMPPSITQSEDSSGIQFINIEETNGNIVFKNGVNVAVAGSVDDADSKPKSITLDANGHTITTTANDYGVITNTISADGKTYTWSAEVYAKAFEGATGNIVISANAKDGAGNTASMPVATVSMDTRAPEPVLTVSFDADENTAGNQVNKKITLNGTTTDNNTLPTNAVTKIQYSLKGDGWAADTATWTDYTDTSNEYSLTGNYSFTVSNFDTTKLDDGETYALRAVATDVAGNIGYSAPVEVIVSQDTDRPVVTLTNLTLAASGTSFLKSTTTLEGTVSDDDGAITSIQYSKDATANWNNLTLNGSSWKISGLAEGANTVYFKVTDSKGSTFTTAVAGAAGTAEIAGQPKIKDSKTDPTYVANNNGSLALGFKVVTQKPTVNIVKYEVWNDSTSAWVDRGPSLGTVGGDYTKIKMTLTARSESFISGAKVTYADTDYAFTCADAEHDDEDEHSWTSAEIPVSTAKSLALAVSDASSQDDPMVYEQNISLAIDNTPPTINIKDPSSTAGVRETMQFDITEAATAYYAVTRKFKVDDNGDDTEEEYTEDDAPDFVWTEILDTSNALARYVFFDDEVNEIDHTDRFALYLTETTTKSKYLGITTLAAIESTTNPYEIITPVKFWVKAVDACGNIGYASKIVNVDPQGNRPAVTLNSPVNVLKNGVSVPPTLGGTIRIDGNVTDDEGAKFVWIRLTRSWKETNNDTTTNISKPFNAETLKYLVSKGYTIGNMNDNTDVAAATINGLAANADVSDYAIKVPVTGTAWNLSINGNQEFNQAAEVDIVLTIYATDEDPDKQDANNPPHIHRSAPITQSIKIDSRTPYINTSELELVKYNGDNEVARKAYKEGEDVDGIWYLQGMIRDDDSGIKTIKYKKNGAENYKDAITAVGGNVDAVDDDAHFYFKKVAHTDDATKFDYNFSVPLGSSASNQVGKDSIQIEATENTTQNLKADPTFNVTYDNKAPVFNTDTSNVFVKLSSDMYNSSGFYTFGAIASEDKVGGVAQSGVERIAFYFTRDLSYSLSELNPTTYSSHTGEKDSKTNDLFDVMIYHSGQEGTDQTSGNMIVNYQGKASGNAKTLTYSDGLYWRTHSGTSNGKSFTYTGNDADPNIHAGGLVKINGVIYKIKTVSGQTITVDKDITGTSADFALCNVIDNSGEKNGASITATHGYGFGYYGTRATDDGDLITESFNAQGTDWIFDASINSKNLPDGPITLHMVAFDKAGNVTTPYSFNGTVKNNAPRIAGLILGTDENGNGSVDSSEFVSAYSGKFTKGYDTAGNEMHDVSFPVIPDGGTQTSLLTVKGLTVVKPEIIGGNGAITYSYQVGSGTVVNGGALSKNGGGTVSGTTDDVVTGSITLPVSAFIGTTNGEDKGLIPDGELSEFKFTFGDSTPGTSLTDTTGKNNATMSVFLDVALRETTKAKNWILPFYWNSKTDNSLFKQSTDEGHIELAPDWVTTTSYTGTTTGEYDADPKVSGRIKIEGIAQDDTLLSAIYVKFGKKVGGDGGFTANTDKAIATYNAGDGNWDVTNLGNDGSINSTTGWASAIQQATYGELVKTGLLDASKVTDDPAKVGTEVNGVLIEYLSTALVKYTSQELGHVVHWILYLDTALVDGAVATDVTITATATDRGKPTWNSTAGAPDYSENTAAVTGTGISGGVTKEENTVNIGALSGNYKADIVPYITDISTGDMDTGTKQYLRRSASGAFVARKGDTTNANITVKGYNLKGAKVYLGNTQLTTTDGNNLSVAKSALTKSENIKVRKTVSGVNIESLNNVNDDSKEYNKEPSQYAPNLTDNRYIYMWDTTTTAYSGAEAVMKPEINGSGAKTGNMVWYYASNVDSMYANGTKLCNSWGGAIVGGNFAYNDIGKPSWVYLHNTSWSGTTSYKIYGSVQWGKEWMNDYDARNWNVVPYDNYETSWFGGTHNGGYNDIYCNTARLGLGNLSFVDDNNYSYNDTVMNRYQNIKVLATGNAEDTLNMVAYFDKSDTSRSIVFWRFHEGTDISNKAQALTYTRSGGNNKAYTFTATSYYSDLTREAGQTKVYGDGDSAVGMKTPLGREELTSGGADSKYFDMVYDSVKNIVYIVYYDEAAGALKITYLNNPGAGSAGNWTNTTWSSAISVDPDAAGQYVAMKTDGSGNIHLAYYDSTGSYLKYALLKWGKDADNNDELKVSKKVLVDTLFTNGMFNSITLRQFGTGDVRPVITSYSISYGGTKYSLRTSWPLTTVANIEAGATEDGYTGKWETVVVVSANAPTQDNTYVETNGTGYTGNIVVGYTASKLEQAVLLLD